MSFSSNGVRFQHHPQWRIRMFLWVMKLGEGVLSILFIISLAGPMVFPGQVDAALGVSQKLSYQGRLTDTSGNPLTGTYYACFSVYDASTAGNKLWPTGTPIKNTVTVTNGVFNLGVGDAETLDFDFSSNDTTYLNVEVSSTNTTCDNVAFEDLSPRQRLDAVAYSRVAAGVYGPALAATSTIVRIGAGSGAGTPVWFNLDNKNTPSTLGAACPSGSVNGSTWYNSSGSRALMCLNNVIAAIDNTNEITSVNIGGNTAGTPAAISAGAISLAGGNNVTLSQNGSTITISGLATPVQGFGMSNIGNTLGTSGTGTGTIVLAGGNNITLSQATAAGARTITISAQNQSAQPVAISGSNGSFAFSTVSFGNLNGLSFYTSNGSIVGSYTAAAGGGYNAVQFTNSTANTTMNILWAGNSNGSGNLTFGLTGSTVTGSAPSGGGGITYSGYAPDIFGKEQVAGQQGQGTFFIQPMWNTPAFQFDRFVMPINFSNTSNLSGSATISFWVGIYTSNNSTLSMLHSISHTTALTMSGTVGSYSLYGGPRNYVIPWTSTFAPNDYWIGIGSRTTTGGANMSISQFLASQPNSVFSGNFGVASAATKGLILGNGFYSATTAGVPAAISFTQIQASGSLNRRQPVYFFGSNTL